mgnify:FL=1
MEQLEDETEALPDAGASGDVVETATGVTTEVSADVDNDEEYDTDIEVNGEWKTILNIWRIGKTKPLCISCSK